VTPLDRITDAVKSFDRAAATAAAQDLADSIRAFGDRYRSGTGKAAVKKLRGARYHDAVLVVADAIFESGEHDPDMLILYAQSLIDSGRLEAALPIVDRVLGLAADHSSAFSEAAGLRGRIYKQLYVNGGGPPELRQHYFDRAFAAYYDFYAAKGNAWHGINAVALMELARRRDLTVPKVKPFATTIFDRMRKDIEAGNADVWDYATAGEAAVATGQFEEAKSWYAKFAAHPDVSAFTLNSALRQLQELWGLTDDKEPGSQILPLLRMESLCRPGGDVALKPRDVAGELGRLNAGFQARFGDERAVPFRWYRQGLERCFSVCRIENAYDQGKGTGFVVRGGDFKPALGDRLCILTNEHVVSNDNPTALRPGQASARFHALDGAPAVLIDDVVWRSPQDDCDAALLSVVDDQLPEVPCYPYVARELQKKDPPEKIFVIGHPNGDALSISLYDNILLDYDDRYVHYRSPTEPGSSGSPVFNDAWELVALHHWGSKETPRLDGSGGKYEANRGVRIDKIRKKAQA
jgi:hypothetical protein